MAEQPSPIPVFDVFLSHNSKDKPTVILLAKRLEAAGVKVWLDAWELRPGHPWQDALEEIIASTRSAAVLVGQDGIGPWENREMRALLNQFVRRGLPVIPVLLPDCPQQPELPLLLQEFTWVDCRKGKEEEGFHRLVWGITGVKPQSIQEPKASSSEVNKPKNVPVQQTAPQKAHRVLPMAGAAALVAVLVGVYFHFPNPAEIKNPLPSGEGKASAEKPVQATPTPSKACADCPQMVRLEGGEFWMGSDDSDKEAFDNEKPKHKVTVRAFNLAKYEVTRGQYAAFVKDTGRPSGPSCWSYKNGSWVDQSGADWRKPGFAQDDKHPAVCISLTDALAYIEWLNHKTGQVFRLPTEAEWEYAARAGKTTSRYWGDNPDDACEYANVADQTAKRDIPGWPSSWTIHNCPDGYAYTAPVGSFKPNDFQLYDMLGNAWEWTCSAYQDNYSGDEKKCLSNNDATVRRAVRGGSWFLTPQNLRSAARDGYDPTERNYYFGFRLAQD